MTPVEQFLNLIGQQGKLLPQGKKTVFHYEFAGGGLLCFKSIRSNDRIRLHNIIVEVPQQGMGTKLMQLVCKIADQCEVVIVLTALPFGDPSMRIKLFKLISWYRDFGFVVNDDYYENHETMDISDGMEMIRDPGFGNPQVVGP